MTAGKESSGRVVAVAVGARHRFSKEVRGSIRLVEGLGVEGDAHSGATVQHVYDRKKDPARANLRQVHLMHAELFAALEAKGFAVGPGELGENVTTEGVALLELAEGTLLRLGAVAVVKVTGLRTPCVQVDRFRAGLMRELVEDKSARRFLSGVMGVVVRGGEVRAGDDVVVDEPGGERRRLVPV